MSRFRNWVWFFVGGFLLGVGASSAQAVSPSEELLPDTTMGFVAVSNVDELVEQWEKTQLGKLMADPVMEPFAKDLRRQFEDRWSGVRERLGLTLDDLKGVPGGEVGVAVILQPTPDKNTPDKHCLALLVDVTGHHTQATALLEKISTNLEKQGAKRSEIKLAESNQPVVRFDNLPKPQDAPETETGPAFHFISGNLLGASDDIQVIRGILARLALPPGQPNSLAAVPGFQEVMRRCARDNDGQRPQIRWFVYPLGYVAAARAGTPEDRRRKGKSVLEILRNQGFGAIQGVGGFVDLYVSEEFQLVHRTAVYAPRPDKYQKSMKMLVFPNGEEFAPQRWVPRDVATYATFYVDVLNAFDNVGSLFDEMFGGLEFLFGAALTCQAELDKGKLPKEFAQEFQEFDITISPQAKISTKQPGSVWEIKDGDETYVVKKREDSLNVYAEMHLWEEVLRGLKNPDDPLAPQIDLRAELIAHLGKRVTVITAYEEPITTTSERLLFAVEATDQEAVKAAIEKTMKTDPDVKLREFEGYDIWEIVEEEHHGPPEIPTITIPSLTGEDAAGPEEPAEDAQQDEDVRLLPHAAVTVAHGHLFVASHIDFLEKVLKPVEERETLNPSLDYRLVDGAIEQMGIAGKCAMVFSRTDEEYRPTYELIRQGKMPQGETMLARVLNAIFSTGKKGEFRPQKIDGEQMPEYDVVRRYLGPAGMAVSSEPNGWFFKGFTLKKP